MMTNMMFTIIMVILMCGMSMRMITKLGTTDGDDDDDDVEYDDDNGDDDDEEEDKEGGGEEGAILRL